MPRKKTDEEQHEGAPMRAFATVRDWRAWLSRHHEAGETLWVKFAKKGSGLPSITYEEARDHAIAFGWIDGLKHGLDEQYYTIRFTPRRARSKWSQINRDVVEKLIAAGEMAPAGLAQVEAAKRDGRWDAAYAGPAKMEVHPDLARALEANRAAREFFATVSSANRFAILYRVQDAKRPETRARRIAQFVDMLARGEVPHPDR
ncbi:MAG: YdeI/OmpD-associated family protein [Sandaracinaceae bacterium]|nr:YdeI/OmpD-associated family protein [Myxococcales bacterium]MCB9662403.1 YdeI/OmpD-associated family protein [Sandaracinaceae bacterium]